MEKLQHLISVDNLSKDVITDIFTKARVFKNDYRFYHDFRPFILRGKRLISLFAEPSTRTRFSFEAAMYDLGGEVLTSEDASTSSSFAKDESIEDAIKVISAYGDIIVLRHKQDGIMARAAKVSPVPLISGGESKREHPTQTLLDLFTIEYELGGIDNISIGMAGDLVNGRTVHSLAKALAKFYKNVRMYFISPNSLSMPKKILEELDDFKVKYWEFKTLSEAPIKDLDCLYMTRIQKERFEDEREFKLVKGCCILRPDIVEQMSDEAIILHPLPRVDEIPEVIDADKRAKYFEQAKNGLFVRMALLDHILR